VKGLLVLAAALVAGCGHGGTGSRSATDAPEIFSADLRAAFAHPEDAMTTTRSSLPLDNGRIVRNCAEYVAAQRAGAAVAESTEARLVASEYVLCDALDALRCTTRGVPGAWPKIGDDLAHRLDLRQFPTSFGPRLGEQMSTLAALGDALRTDETSVELATDDWKFVLRLVAVADVDGDGKSDWIVSLADEARNGTYRDYELLVVSDPERAGALRAHTWPPKGSLRPCAHR
jgi:hypothetical protein